MTKKNDCKKINYMSGLAVCKKNLFARVVMQNAECEIACGRRVGEVCADGCIPFYRNENIRNNRGTFQFRNVKIDKSDYDILMINNGESILTLLYNLSEKRMEDAGFFEKFGLTTRELSIVMLVSQGLSNQSISEQLYISPKTLKTHINNILKKIPRKYWPR